MRYRRRSIRLKDYNYSDFGYYFVTICAQDRELYFGNIVNARIKLSKFGKIAQEYLLQTPMHFKNTKIDEYIVMPNHLHVIIFINKCRGLIYQTQNYQINNQNHTGRDKSRPYITNNPMLSKSPILGKIIRYFKAQTTHKIRENYFTMFSWQRNYYERIIRNNHELNRIRLYIQNNPDNWETDRNNPKFLEIKN